MPIPSAFTDLDTNPNNNSPQGAENVGPNANGYIQALGAFIKQIYNGAVKPLATVDFNAQILTNLLPGSTTSTSKDALTGAQVRGLAYKVGEVRSWHGAIANIATIWGAGWQLADGTNGTADLRNQFIVGAGSTYAPGATGGLSTVVLTTAQLPAHNHGITDAGHTHVLTDSGHAHGITDAGHSHATPGTFVIPGTSLNQEGTNSRTLTTVNNPGTDLRGTGITINPAGTGIGINPAFTGITTQNNGSGTAIENKPPYFALCFLEYTGISA